MRHQNNLNQLKNLSTMMKNKKRAVWLLACFLMAGFTTAQEKKESSRTPSGSKEEGNRNVYVHTRNHSVVSLATDEIVLNVFWNKLIEKENLLSKGCSGADFLQAIHNLAERYGITDEMTKNFLVYNFQKEKTQNGKKR